jgi:hypothetical protein
MSLSSRKALEAAAAAAAEEEEEYRESAWNLDFLRTKKGMLLVAQVVRTLLNNFYCKNKVVYLISILLQLVSRSLNSLCGFYKFLSNCLSRFARSLAALSTFITAASDAASLTLPSGRQQCSRRSSWPSTWAGSMPPLTPRLCGGW